MKRIVAWLAAMFASLWCFADVPPLLNYQGRLLDGTNLVNGSVGLSLRLFDASAAGTLLYEDSNTVAVADGLYATLIGDGTVFGNLQLALENSNVWIEVAVNGTALTPRERLVSAAYAVKAQHTEIFTGAVLDAQLSTNIARLSGTNQTFSGPVNFTSVSNTFAGTFSGNGIGVTNVSFESITVDRTPVIAWGNDFFGQTAGPASATGIVAIACSGNKSLALRGDGTVIAWGDNIYGQTNVPASATGVVAIAGGAYFGLALRSDETVIAWGDNSYGQTNVPASATGVVAIAGGGDHSLALRRDGRVIAWGHNNSGQTNVPASATGVVAIAGGIGHSLALRGNGMVIAWGDNSYGQTTVPASATGVVAIAGGRFFSLALRGDGSVIAWGRNDYGQTNVPASATGVVAIAASYEHSLALRGDGTVIAWGRNSSGQTNVPASATGVVEIAAGAYHSLALRSPQARVPAQLARLDAATNWFAGTVNATTFSGNLIAGTVTITGTTIITGTFLGSPPYIKVAETQAKGTDAGGNGATTNNFRDLNTELADTHDLATVTNGNVMLPAGTYHCRIGAPAYRVDEHQIRLRIVNGATLLYGTSEFSDDALSPGVQTRSLIDGSFTLASNATLTVQHFTAVIKTVNGLGLAASATWTDSVPHELYTVAEFWKIK